MILTTILVLLGMLALSIPVAAVLGDLALRIIEIGWHCDDCLADTSVELHFSNTLELI